MIGVIGDVMLDFYIFGKSTRMSPECVTAQVVNPETVNYYLGGAGNTALNIKNLDADVKLYCALHKKSKMPKLMCQEKLKAKATINSNKDVVKKRIYSNGKYLARLDYDYEVIHDEQYLINELFSEPPSLIVLSDYNKGTINCPEALITRAQTHNIPVLVDPKKKLDRYSGAYILKPNAKEFIEWVGVENVILENEFVNSLSNKYLQNSVEKLNVHNLIITLGKLGSILVSRTGGVKKFKAFSVPNTVDVTGAGDSFMAGLAVSLQEQYSIADSIQFANKVAGIAVTKKGTTYVERKEI